LFSVAGLIPHARPTRGDIFGSVKVDYKLFTNLLGTAIFCALFVLTMLRGATDPMCGMKVDKQEAIAVQRGAHTDYFCSCHCAERYAAAERSAAA
jgi:YHS domain-containing protein